MVHPPPVHGFDLSPGAEIRQQTMARSEYSTSQYVAAMDTPFRPDGLPAVFDGGAWRSHDRRFFWNGATWVPAKTSAAAPWLMKIGTSVVLLALLGFAVYTMIATQSEYTTG
jgi:hypothetical protein